MKLSIVIPAYNEASSITETVTTLFQKLVQEEIEHEILVINDNSTDDTLEVLKALTITIDTLKVWLCGSLWIGKFPGRLCCNHDGRSFRLTGRPGKILL